MDQEFSWSFRNSRSDSFLARVVGRSHSSRLILETSSFAAECALITKYERLSQSMEPSPPPPPPPPPGWQQAGVGRILARFMGRKLGELPNAEKDTRNSTPEEGTLRTKKKTKRRRRWSSWLPDPDRRWPVQGW